MTVALALETLAERLARLGRAPLSARMADAVNRRIYDCLVATRLGAEVAESRPLKLLLGAHDAANAPEDMVRALVAMTRATEVDDIHIGACVTPAAVVIPVALVMADHLGADADAMRRGIVAGYEAMILFGQGLRGPFALFRGIWPTYATAPLGAAAVICSFSGMSQRETLSALCLALARSAPRLNDAVPRWLSVGCAAVDGLAAARAIGAGFSLSSDSVSNCGEENRVDLEYLVEVPRGWGIDSVDFKMFPGCRQASAAVEACRRLIEDGNRADIARIEVRVPEPYTEMISSPRFPQQRLESLVSAAYQIAVAIAAPDCLYDVRRERLADTAEVRALFDGVVIQPDPELTAQYPGKWGARVRICRTRGEIKELELMVPAGAAESSRAWGDLRAKSALLARANGVGLEELEEIARILGEGDADLPARLLRWTRSALQNAWHGGDN